MSRYYLTTSDWHDSRTLVYAPKAEGIATGTAPTSARTQYEQLHLPPSIHHLSYDDCLEDK